MGDVGAFLEKVRRAGMAERVRVEARDAGRGTVIPDDSPEHDLSDATSDTVQEQSPLLRVVEQHGATAPDVSIESAERFRGIGRTRSFPLGPRSERRYRVAFPALRLPISTTSRYSSSTSSESHLPAVESGTGELFSKITTRNRASFLPEEVPDSLIGLSRRFSQVREGVGQDLARKLVSDGVLSGIGGGKRRPR